MAAQSVNYLITYLLAVHYAEDYVIRRVTNTQWRSKALTGPGSTVNWGALPSLTSTFPSLPFPSLFPSCSPVQPLPLPRSGPQMQLGCLEESSKLPQRGLVHFSVKIRHLVATILMIFLRVLPKIFLWPHHSGAPGARGPRFIEPPEPPVHTPLGMCGRI